MLRIMSLVALTVLASPVSALAARYVPIRVYVNEELILEGSASDNGKRDADELWDALKTARLKETDAFRKVIGERKGDEIEVSEADVNAGRLSVRIEVRYGGTAEAKSVRIQKVVMENGLIRWKIHSDDVELLFSSRMIRRSDAKSLVAPHRER